MQVNGVGHHGGTDNANGNRQGRAIGDPRRNEAARCCAPADGRNEQFDQIANAYEGYKGANGEFDPAEARASEHEDPISNNRGRHHTG